MVFTLVSMTSQPQVLVYSMKHGFLPVKQVTNVIVKWLVTPIIAMPLLNKWECIIWHVVLSIYS